MRLYLRMVKENKPTGEHALTLIVPWLRRLVAGLLQRRPESVHVEFVVDKVAQGQVFLRVLRFSPTNITPLWLSKLVHYLGYEQHVGRRSPLQPKFEIKF
jgi:hypothetical protein